MRRIYDTQGQHYFITSKTYQNKSVFTDDKKVKLLLQCINYLAKQKYFKLFAWVILPDHLHLLLEIIGKKNISEVIHDFKSYTANKISPLILQRRRGFHASPSQLNSSRSAPLDSARGLRKASATVDNEYQTFVGGASTEKTFHQPVAQASRPGRPLPKVIKLWQTSFHDHIIRDQNDLYNHLDYIHYNAVKHGHVERPEDWPWSSYHTFLKRGYYETGWGLK